MKCEALKGCFFGVFVKFVASLLQACLFFLFFDSVHYHFSFIFDKVSMLPQRVEVTKQKINYIR